MDAAELVLKFMQALAWPLFAAGALWAFRDRIPRVARLEFGSVVGIDFATDAQQTHERIAANTTEDLRSVAQRGDSLFAALRVVAASEPRKAVVAGWTAVYASVFGEVQRRAVQRRALSPDEARSLPPVAGPELEGWAELQALGELALNGSRPITPQAAKEYLQACELMVTHIGATWVIQAVGGETR